MRIVLVTQEEPFYVPPVVDRVLRERHNDVVAVVTPRDRRWLARYSKMLHRGLTVYGAWGSIRQGTRFLSYRVLDRLSTARGGRPYSVRSVARRYGIPLLTPRSVNDEPLLRELRRLNTDIIASISADQVFGKALLSLPRYGCINVHSSLLPKYRGLYPSFWVLANRETETGVTVHYMDTELDNGDILLQRRVSITPQETQHSLLLKTKSLSAELLLEALDRIEKGDVATQPNRAEEGSYFSFPTAEDVRRFRADGRTFW